MLVVEFVGELATCLAPDKAQYPQKSRSRLLRRRWGKASEVLIGRDVNCLNLKRGSCSTWDLRPFRAHLRIAAGAFQLPLRRCCHGDLTQAFEILLVFKMFQHLP